LASNKFPCYFFGGKVSPPLVLDFLRGFAAAFFAGADFLDADFFLRGPMVFLAEGMEEH